MVMVRLYKGEYSHSPYLTHSDGSNKDLDMLKVLCNVYVLLLKK